MTAEKLTRVIYTSVGAPGFDASDLTSILEVARRRNAERAVTGMLLYSSGTFFQVLEGDEATLAELFTTISADPRHSKVTVIIREPIAQRNFSDWTMGFASESSSELAQIDGLNDFFQEGTSLSRLDPGRAKNLLSAFAQGRWRARLTGTAK